MQPPENVAELVAALEQCGQLLPRDTTTPFWSRVIRPVERLEGRRTGINEALQQALISSRRHLSYSISYRSGDHRQDSITNLKKYYSYRLAADVLQYKKFQQLQEREEPCITSSNIFAIDEEARQAINRTPTYTLSPTVIDFPPVSATANYQFPAVTTTNGTTAMYTISTPPHMSRWVEQSLRGTAGHYEPVEWNENGIPTAFRWTTLP